MNNNVCTLAKKIAKTFNIINNNMFTDTEISEAVKEYVYLLKNEKSTIVNLIEEECDNGNKEILDLASEVLAF